jgi:biopolymer transport protein ExbD
VRDFLIVKELRKKLDMPAKLKHRSAEISTSSVADVAFLLLSFFLMTTVIESDTGLTLTLPEWRDEPIQVQRHERNIFNIHINSRDAVMIEGEVSQLAGLKGKIRNFLLNNGINPALSESPQNAVISLKTDRGTSHSMFVQAMDEIQGAYYEIYSARVNLSVENYRKLSYEDPIDRKIIDRAKEGFPMNISLAEPTEIGAGK